MTADSNWLKANNGKYIWYPFVDPKTTRDNPPLIIERASGVKCDRCWRYVPVVSTDPELAGLCERCQDALAEPVNG